MGSRQLVVFGLALALAGLTCARFLGSKAPTYWGPEVRRPAEVAGAEPERTHSRAPAGGLGGTQLRPAVQPPPWRFPEVPAEPVKGRPARLQPPPQRPAATGRVAVRCGESRVQVEASRDLFGLGRLVEPERMTLGGCPTTDVDDVAHVLIFESELHGCGSTLVMTDTAFIYAFTLVYSPDSLGRSPITRSQRAVIGVECHYPR